MRTSKRLASALLAALLLLGTAACSDGGVDSGDGGAENGAVSTSGDLTPTSPEEAAAQETDGAYTDSLPEADFSGSTFGVYTSNNINSWTLPTTLNHAEEETGEVVNDALFARDLWLESRYGVKLDFTVDGTTPAGAMSGPLEKNILAGDDTYNLILQDVACVAKPLTMDGCAYPLNLCDGIRLEEDYWMPALNGELKFGENQFLCASAISPRFYGSVYLYLFNRDLTADLGMPDLYELVREGGWTLDRQYELSAEALADLDGDGAYGNGDRYGLCWEVLTPEAVVLGCGYHLVKNVDGQLAFMIEEEGLVDVLMAMGENFHKDYAFQDSGRTKLNVNAILNGGQFLFLNTCTFNLAEFRDFTFDYGILPMPKKDEAQPAHISYAQPWVVVSPVIPVTVTGDELTMTGTLTDAMAAYGYDYLRPAVFDNVIQMKGTRDEQSAGIVNSLFDNVTFELATIYGFGSFYTTFTNAFENNQTASLMSVWAKVRKSADKELARICETYDAVAAKLAGN